MTTSRWLLPFILALSLLVIGSSCSREENEGLQAKSTAASSQQQKPLQAKWLGFNDGLDKARTENKPIFVEFYTDWCAYCRKFQRETIQNQNVARMLSENFIYVRLDAEDSNNQIKYKGKFMSNVELTRAFGVTGFPTLVFLESAGQPITKIDGFVPPVQFSAILNYVEQKCYQTKISFRDFVRKGRCN